MPPIVILNKLITLSFGLTGHGLGAAMSSHVKKGYELGSRLDGGGGGG